MFKKLKIKIIQLLIKEMNSHYSKLYEEKMQEEINSMEFKDLVRQNLGSIKCDLSYYKSLNNKESRAYINEIAPVSKNISFQNLCKFLMVEQTDFIVKNFAGSDIKTVFASGTINGIAIVMEEVNKIATIAESKSKEEKFDKHQII